MSTANPHYPGKYLPVAIPLPPVRRAPPRAQTAPPSKQVLSQPETPAWDFLREERPRSQQVRAKTTYKREKNNSYSEVPLLLIGISSLAILAAFVVSQPKEKYTYENNNPQNMWFTGPPAPRFPWHEKVSDPVQQRPTNNPVEVMVLNAMEPTNRNRLEFSPNKFMSSVTGWVIISGAIIIVCSISMLLRGGGRKSKIEYR